jgi:hypothetical protein
VTQDEIEKHYQKQNRTGYTVNQGHKHWFVKDDEHPYTEVKRFDWMRGYHVGSLFLWRRYKLPASVQAFGGVEVACAAGGSQLVIDGQQRIGSLVRAFVSGRFSFHLLNGTFHVDAEGPWLCPLVVLINPSGVDSEVGLDNPPSWEWAAEHAAKHGLEERAVRGLVWSAVDPVTRAQVSVTYVDYHHSREEVVESFRRMNTAGRRFDERELLDAMRRAEEEGATDTGDR